MWCLFRVAGYVKIHETIQKHATYLYQVLGNYLCVLLTAKVKNYVNYACGDVEYDLYFYNLCIRNIY